MEIKNLLNIPQEKLIPAFHEAFLNYFVPFPNSFEETKIYWEHVGINLNFSYAAFDGDRIVAFILNTPLEGTLYTFAMGVIPSHRGLHLIEKIFQFLPKDFDQYKLEVITQNVKALNLYHKLGYKIDRELHSYQGCLNLPEKKMAAIQYDIKELSESDEIKSIRLFIPSSEASFTALSKIRKYCETHELRIEGKLKAYAHYVPETLSVKEIGAMEPFQENLDLLFHEMKLQREKLRFMNIDHEALSFRNYLESRGMTRFISQYEMVLKMPSVCGSDNQ